jgi:hypothetical protein
MSPSDARFFLLVFLAEDRFDRAASGRDRFSPADLFEAA